MKASSKWLIGPTALGILTACASSELSSQTGSHRAGPLSSSNTRLANENILVTGTINGRISKAISTVCWSTDLNEWDLQTTINGQTWTISMRLPNPNGKTQTLNLSQGNYLVTFFEDLSPNVPLDQQDNTQYSSIGGTVTMNADGLGGNMNVAMNRAADPTQPITEHMAGRWAC